MPKGIDTKLLDGLYQGYTNSSWCGICVYTYMYVWRYVWHNSSACHAYVMCAELGHCHFLYVPAVLNVSNHWKWHRH